MYLININILYNFNSHNIILMYIYTKILIKIILSYYNIKVIWVKYMRRILFIVL